MSNTRPLDPRLTEQRNPRSRRIDQLSTIEIVDLINAEDRMVAVAVGEEREAIAKCIDLVVDSFDLRSRLAQISGWAAVSAAISLVMGVLENQGGTLGTIAARLVGMAWTLVTFLAVPVIAIEGTGPFETIKRSASLFRERWGQQITGNIAIGAAVFLLGVLPAIVLIGGGIAVWSSASFLGALLVVIGALVLAIALLVSRALSGIFGVALYRYALDGETVGGFTQEELESAVKAKGRRWGKSTPPGATPGTI